MKDAGVDCSIILPVLTKPEQFKKVNEFAVKLNEKYDGIKNVKLISFGGIHPDSSDYKYELREIVHMGLKGIKLHPDYQDTMLDEVAPEKLVLAHFGGYKCWNDVEEYLVGQKVYFDTAFIYNTIAKEQFLIIIKNHGDGKVLFATDSPWSGQKEAIKWLDNLQLSSETLSKILYKNALELLKI